jgi:TRAP-type C4-dicarboxylate transport system permease small subunit
MSDHRPPVEGAEAPAMGLAKFARQLEALYSPVYTWFGYLGAAVLGLLVLAMMYSVIGRRFFGTPLPGSSDIIEMSLLVMTATVLGAEHMGHEKMTVDVIVRRLPARAQRVIAPLVYLVAIGILCVALWQVIAWGIKVQGRGETTPARLSYRSTPSPTSSRWGCSP